MVKLAEFFILFIAVFPSVIISWKPLSCEQSCPGGPFPTVPYPFGFNSGCEIQLNCTSNGDVFIGEFSVQQLNISEGLILVDLPTKCGRPVNALTQLYSEHYAPISTNAILMKNCTKQMDDCVVSMKSLYQDEDCSGAQGGYGNTSCYSSDITRMFLDYENMTSMGCQLLFSGVATEIFEGSSVVSLEAQTVRLGWLVGGSCDCSDHADCTAIVSPVDGSDGHRCKCNSGFDGDGYKAGSGCRGTKGSFYCHLISDFIISSFIILDFFQPILSY
ncbi:hypothetical protein SSX86_015939 [Deinandra increscens subsp. villosa]|uniref:Uncharacterized protein n=1 Tax=Deinandra increscens subsp. villosa TaxID=3103831 RepID=A0AAP0GXX9_9ASTR